MVKVTRAYLNGLMDFAKANPGSPDAPEALRQIVLLYEALGETDKAEAWRRNLLRGEKDGKAKDPIAQPLPDGGRILLGGAKGEKSKDPKPVVTPRR